MSTVTADTPYGRLTGEHDAKCADCERRAEFIVLTEGDNGPTYCAVHFALVAARVSGMIR